MIQYSIFSRDLAARFISCSVLGDMDIGLDHCPVQVKFCVSSIKRHQTRRRRGAKKFAADPTRYDSSLQSSLHKNHPTGMDTEAQAAFLETVVLRAADDAAVCEPASNATGCRGSQQTVEELIAKRRGIKGIPDLTAAERQRMRNSVSKQIQKEIRQALSHKRHEKIKRTLHEFRGLKQIALCTTAKRRADIIEMVDEHGCRHSDQASIADAFASFYEKLYAGRKMEKGPGAARTQLQPFTQEELGRTLGISPLSPARLARILPCPSTDYRCAPEYTSPPLVRAGRFRSGPHTVCQLSTPGVSVGTAWPVPGPHPTGDSRGRGCPARTTLSCCPCPDMPRHYPEYGLEYESP